MTEGETRCCLWAEPEQHTAEPHEAFLLTSQTGTEQQWLKGYWILAKRALSNFADKLWQTGKCFFQLYVCGSAAMLLKPWYMVFCPQQSE